MKIVSRPTEDEATVSIGSGSNCLMLSDEQLELVTALVSSCRLGGGTYSRVAYEILNLLESEFGAGYIENAIDNIPVGGTIEDDTDGTVVCTTKGHDYSLTIELS